MKPVIDVFRTGNMSKGRLEAFSDGVIGVIITILVLEIHLPNTHLTESELIPALIDLMPKIISYVVSFVFVAVWWVAHHQLFHIIDRTDRGLLWLNSLFLLFLSFLPFPTAMIGEYPHSKISAIIYGLTGIFTGLSFVGMRWYACFKASLVSPTISKEILASAIKKGMLSPTLYFLGVLSSFVSVYISLAIYVLIPCYFFVPGILEKHNPSPNKENSNES